jgi:hypothetical protein
MSDSKVEFCKHSLCLLDYPGWVKAHIFFEAVYHTDLPGLNQKKMKTHKFRAQGIGIPSSKHKNPNVARVLIYL